MKNLHFAIFAAAVLLPLTLSAQSSDSALQYRRSSMYSFMISHPDLKMDDEIVNAFMLLETPDKYNNHDLSVKCVTTPSSNKKDDLLRDVDEYLQRNDIAKRLVSKWFLRSKETGGFDPSLVMSRGMYGATAMDIEAAAQSKRGIDALGDKGYEMISNTFVIVNDITYVDHEKNADIAAGVLSIIGGIAAGVTGDDNNIVTSLSTLGAMVSTMIAGFTVKTTSYLYQLDWNDEVANYFYEHYYYDKPGTDSLAQAAFAADTLIPLKKAAYEADSTTFKLKYIGKYMAKSAKPVLRGLYNPEDVFRKVCARAIDNNVMELQKEFDQFKVKVPLISTEPLTAYIGMKEGVTPKSKYEVLVPVFDEATGKYKYNRRGVIRPVPGKIWDNRYMANEEEAAGSEFNATTFEVVSGMNFTPGMLIREIK